MLRLTEDRVIPAQSVLKLLVQADPQLPRGIRQRVGWRWSPTRICLCTRGVAVARSWGQLDENREVVTAGDGALGEGGEFEGEGEEEGAGERKEEE